MLSPKLTLPARISALRRLFPAPELEPSINDGHAALGEVPADKLGGTAPGHNVDKVGGFLAVDFVVPVTGDGEGRDGNAVFRAAELGVPHKTAHNGDVI